MQVLVYFPTYLLPLHHLYHSRTPRLCHKHTFVAVFPFFFVEPFGRPRPLLAGEAPSAFFTSFFSSFPGLPRFFASLPCTSYSTQKIIYSLLQKQLSAFCVCHYNNISFNMANSYFVTNKKFFSQSNCQKLMNTQMVRC